MRSISRWKNNTHEARETRTKQYSSTVLVRTLFYTQSTYLSFFFSCFFSYISPLVFFSPSCLCVCVFYLFNLGKIVYLVYIFIIVITKTSSHCRPHAASSRVVLWRREKKGVARHTVIVVQNVFPFLENRYAEGFFISFLFEAKKKKYLTIIHTRVQCITVLRDSDQFIQKLLAKEKFLTLECDRKNGKNYSTYRLTRRSF